MTRTTTLIKLTALALIITAASAIPFGFGHHDQDFDGFDGFDDDSLLDFPPQQEPPPRRTAGELAALRGAGGFTTSCNSCELRSDPSALHCASCLTNQGQLAGPTSAATFYETTDGGFRSCSKFINVDGNLVCLELELPCRQHGWVSCAAMEQTQDAQAEKEAAAAAAALAKAKAEALVKAAEVAIETIKTWEVEQIEAQAVAESLATVRNDIGVRDEWEMKTGVGASECILPPAECALRAEAKRIADKKGVPAEWRKIPKALASPRAKAPKKSSVLPTALKAASKLKGVRAQKAQPPQATETEAHEHDEMLVEDAPPAETPDDSSGSGWYDLQGKERSY